MDYRYWKISGILDKQISKMLFIANNKVSNDINKFDIPTNDNIENLIDDNSDTYVTINADNWSATYDFDEPTNLIKIVFVSSTNDIDKLTLEYSNDNENWNIYQSAYPVIIDDEVIVNLLNINDVKQYTSENRINFLSVVHHKTKSRISFDETVPYASLYKTDVSNELKNLTYEDIEFIDYTTKIHTNDRTYVNSFLSGHGYIEGYTYEKDESTIIESKIDLLPIGYCNKKISVDTQNGKFTINNLSLDVDFDVYATPKNNEYTTKLAKSIKPKENVKLLDLKIFMAYDNVHYQNIKRTYNTSVFNSAGNLTYSISNAPDGVTINDDGILTLQSKDAGKKDFLIEVSDDKIERTVSYPVSIDFMPTELHYLPLENNTLDIETNEVWQTEGDLEFFNGWGKFTNNAHIHNNIDITPLINNKIFISFKMVKYSLIDNNHFYGSILYSNNIDNLNNVTYVILFGVENDENDDRRLCLRVNKGTKFRTNYRFNEYREYDISIVKDNNKLNFYINGMLDVSHELSNKDLQDFNSDFISPLLIGTNKYDTDDKKGSFGGLLKDIKIYNGYSTKPKNVEYTKNSVYELNPNTLKTNYGEEFDVNNVTTKVVNGNNSFVFNDENAYLKLNINNINMLLTDTFTIEIWYRCVRDNIINTLYDQAPPQGGFTISHRENYYIAYNSIRDGSKHYEKYDTLDNRYKDVKLKIIKNGNKHKIYCNDAVINEAPLFDYINSTSVYIGRLCQRDYVERLIGFISKFKITDAVDDTPFKLTDLNKYQSFSLDGYDNIDSNLTEWTNEGVTSNNGSYVFDGNSYFKNDDYWILGNSGFRINLDFKYDNLESSALIANYDNDGIKVLIDDEGLIHTQIKVNNDIHNFYSTDKVNSNWNKLSIIVQDYKVIIILNDNIDEYDILGAYNLNSKVWFIGTESSDLTKKYKGQIKNIQVLIDYVY